MLSERRTFRTSRRLAQVWWEEGVVCWDWASPDSQSLEGSTEFQSMLRSGWVLSARVYPGTKSSLRLSLVSLMHLFSVFSIKLGSVYRKGSILTRSLVAFEAAEMFLGVLGSVAKRMSSRTEIQ